LTTPLEKILEQNKKIIKSMKKTTKLETKPALETPRPRPLREAIKRS